MRIVTFISIGDVIGNLPYLSPLRPQTGTVECDLSGFMNLAGYPMEWMWTVALIYLLYSLAVRGKVPTTLWPIHLLCWGVPLTLALMSLAFGPYSTGEQPTEVCSIGNGQASIIYHAVSYYGLLILCVLALIYFYFKIYYHEYFQNDVKVATTSFAVAKNATQFYALLLIIFWIPHTVTAAAYHLDLLYNIFLVWKILHGLATAVVFFVQSQESRRLWKSLVFGVTDEKARILDAQNRIISEDSTSPIDIDDVLENSTYNRTLETGGHELAPRLSNLTPMHHHHDNHA